MRECIKKKIAAGVIDVERGQEVLGLLDETEEFLKSSRGSADGAEEAVLKRLADKVVNDKRRAALKAKAMTNVLAAGRSNEKGFLKGVEGMIYADGTGKVNFEAKRDALIAQANAQMGEGLKKIRTDSVWRQRQRFRRERGEFGQRNFRHSNRRCGDERVSQIMGRGFRIFARQI